MIFGLACSKEARLFLILNTINLTFNKCKINDIFNVIETWHAIKTRLKIYDKLYLINFNVKI